MNQARHVAYRLRLADGFLAEAQQDITLSRWRSAIDNAQLTIENSAKAVLRYLGLSAEHIIRRGCCAVPLKRKSGMLTYLPKSNVLQNWRPL